MLEILCLQELLGIFLHIALCQKVVLIDVTMDLGSLLLNAHKYSNEPDTIAYFGEEFDISTYNLTRINMILHNVSIEN